MPTPRHLNRAPITEAIIYFRVKARLGFDSQQFAQLQPALSERFPRMQQRRGGKITFQFALAGAEPPKMEDLGLQGVSFTSPDGKLTAQFRTDGFSLHRLKPYTSWNELLPMGLELWRMYYSTAQPEAVTRLSLRYINRIPLPPDLNDLNRYLRAVPIVPPELPQHLSAFLVRTTIHDPSTKIAANVAQTLQTNAATKQVSLILDIDAFRGGSWLPNDPLLPQTLSQLHDFKNLVFFSLVTDETLRQFE